MTTILNKKILLSLGTLVFVGAVALGATGAFFSDTETSTGNTFTAGAIDLGVDNESYYNGVLNQGTSWELDWDLSDETPRQLFNFLDLKPGDWGEDTISLHVKNNDSYLCADVTLTSNEDNDQTEPEIDDGDLVANNGPQTNDGELASHLRFVWWADDGDNVLEDNETPIHNNVPLGSGTVALADSQTNIWGDLNGTLPGNGPLPGASTRYIAKAWCFGALTTNPLSQDGLGTTSPRTPANSTGGVACNGADETNITQTDSVTLDVAFRAVQSRNNTSFVCSAPTQGEQRPRVGALLSAYDAPTCNVTVSGSGSIQTAVGNAEDGDVVCVDSTYNGSGDSAAIRIENAGVTLAATVRGVDLFDPIVLSASNVTVTGFDGVIGQAESPAEQAAFYLDNDADLSEISFNTVTGGTGAAILTETGAALGGGLIANNVLGGATQGIYTNPHTGVFVIEYNDIDNNAAGIGGLMGAIVRNNEFEHTVAGSEAIGVDSTHDANPATVSFNNFLGGTKLNTYGPIAGDVDAEDNFWGPSGGAAQTGGSDEVDFTPEEVSAFLHN